MKTCLICTAPFAPQKNSKTCSPECSRARKARRERAYIKAHPEQRRASQARWREVVSHVGLNRRVNRAVRLLFALTGET